MTRAFDDVGLRRVLSVQSSIVFNNFVRMVIRNPQGRIADIVIPSGVANQSSVMKSLNNLNDQALRSTGSNLFWKSESGHWFCTPLGEAIFLLTDSIQRRFEETGKWIDENPEISNLRIAMNSYSFATFMQIEGIIQKTDPSLQIKKDFRYFRSPDVWQKVAMRANNLDVGITDGFGVPEITGDINAIEIGPLEIKLLSNFELPDDKLVGREKISVDYLRTLPLMVGSNRNFFEYLMLILKDAPSFRMISGMSADDILAFVRDRYRIEEMSESTQILMDMLTLGSGNAVMLATPEVLRHIMALYRHGDTPFGRKIRAYSIDDGMVRLRKYALRRVREPNMPKKPVVEMFWEAAGKMANPG